MIGVFRGQFFRSLIRLIRVFRGLFQICVHSWLLGISEVEQQFESTVFAEAKR